MFVTPTAIFNAIDPKRTCAGQTRSGPASRLPQDDLDATVLKLAHAGRRGYERSGIAEALDVDRGLRHAAANQFCFVAAHLPRRPGVFGAVRKAA